MAQAGFTPIRLYYSTTPGAVPTAANLLPGELSINIADGKLFYENSGGTVTEFSAGVSAGKSIAFAMIFGL
jgi:hypothetical protein